MESVLVFELKIREFILQSDSRLPPDVFIWNFKICFGRMSDAEVEGGGWALSHSFIPI